MSSTTRTRTRVGASGALLSLVLLLSGCLYALIPADDARSDNGEGAGAEAVYTVDSTGALTPQPTDEAAEMWETFERVVTPSYAARVVSEFHVTDDPTSEFSAAVTREDERDSWILSADVYLADDPDELFWTMVHEYGHLLSLSTAEVAPGPGSCPTLELQEGCATESSALYDFHKEFWAQYTDAPPTGNDDEDIAQDFFDDHEDEFVDEYAAWNVVEDFAETFVVFASEPGYHGASVIDRKLKFFWDRPDYVEIRKRIRVEFGI